MFDEILKLPGIQDAKGSLLWFLAIASVVLGLANHLGALYRERKNEKKLKADEEAGLVQAKTSQFDSISAAEARFRDVALRELEQLRDRFSALELRYETLKEQYDALDEQYEKLERQYNALLAKADTSQETLERIERNTEK